MAIDFQIYHKNIGDGISVDGIALVISSAFDTQKSKLQRHSETDVRLSLLQSFFQNDKPNILSKKYTPLEKHDANTIIINLDNVEFEEDTCITQKAISTYYIDFFARNNTDSESFDAISYAAGIIRETLLKTPLTRFDAQAKKVKKLEIYPEKTNSFVSARMTIEITTIEPLTDFDALDGAHENFTTLSVNYGKSDGTDENFTTVKSEWQKLYNFEKKEN